MRTGPILTALALSALVAYGYVMGGYQPEPPPRPEAAAAPLPAVRPLSPVLHTATTAAPVDTAAAVASAGSLVFPLYEVKRLGDMYVICGVKVIVNIEYTLPKWAFPPNTMKDAEYQEWTRYFELVEAHERTHRDISMRHARLLLDSLKAMPPGSTEIEVHMQAANVRHQEMLRLQTDQHKFDETEYKRKDLRLNDRAGR